MQVYRKGYWLYYIVLWHLGHSMPYQHENRTTLSDLEETWCVGNILSWLSTSNQTLALYAVWLPRKSRLNSGFFDRFCYTDHHKNTHNLANFHFENTELILLCSLFNALWCGVSHECKQLDWGQRSSKPCLEVSPLIFGKLCFQLFFATTHLRLTPLPCTSLVLGRPWVQEIHIIIVVKQP